MAKNMRQHADEELGSLRAASAPKLEVVQPDDFDLEAIRTDANMLEGVAAKVPLTIPIRRPPKHERIRVRPEPAYRITVGAIELKEEGEFYILTGDLGRQLLGTEASLFTLYTYTTRVGALGLWPIRQPGTDGRQNEWHRTAEKAAELAMHSWIRVVSNKAIGGYEVLQAVVKIPDPVWPDRSLKEIIQVAAADRGMIVGHPDHPILRKLEGRL
jgi:hypothetical protein